eukprot:CAMPEP_0175152698 /NCGR_PEP_ID=MMETSP0087-20121206/19274_1 /TAXON_ID=136419 /ORGANISM="Unknown Unknown, Strain D1" /LENGTH=163 /DNA_ID=CAMNT_0016439191 /DNA_START=25 /DNA_END=513 /DNA_ORIENTATION=+
MFTQSKPHNLAAYAPRLPQLSPIVGSDHHAQGISKRQTTVHRLREKREQLAEEETQIARKLNSKVGEDEVNFKQDRKRTSAGTAAPVWGRLSGGSQQQDKAILSASNGLQAAKDCNQLLFDLRRKQKEIRTMDDRIDVKVRELTAYVKKGPPALKKPKSLSEW